MLSPLPDAAPRLRFHIGAKHNLMKSLTHVLQLTINIAANAGLTDAIVGIRTLIYRYLQEAKLGKLGKLGYWLSHDQPARPSASSEQRQATALSPTSGLRGAHGSALYIVSNHDLLEEFMSVSPILPRRAFLLPD